MTPHPQKAPAEAPLPDSLAQAGDWLLRLAEEELDADTLNEWLEWYHADAENREAFDRLQREYEQFRSLPELQRRRLAVAADAAAEPPAAEPAVRRKPRGRAAAGFALAATVVFGVALGLWQADILFGDGVRTGSVRTAAGETRTLSLPDGSRLTLAPDSGASYRFSGAVRYIALDSGEGFFDVERETNRPFIVHVDDMTVRAVGTAFNVRRGAGNVVVTVTEGIVDMQRNDALPVRKAAAPAEKSEPAMPVLRLAAGEKAVVPAAPPPAALAPDHPAAKTWQAGRLEFVDEPLSDVIAAVNRHAGRDIILTDPDAGKLTLTGSVMHDHIDEWLFALPDIFPIQVEAAGHRAVLVSLKRDS